MNQGKSVQIEFQKLFGADPVVVRSPGRINVIGEHTDYNEGFVLPAAIDRYIEAAFGISSSPVCRVVSLDKSEGFSFDISEDIRLKTGSWQNFIIGVVREIEKTGRKVRPFNLVFSGNIPQGAGLSSSAALENALVVGLNELHGWGMDKKEMIRIGQLAEHNYVGVMCGIMDQFASMFGKEEKAIFLDCRSLEYQYYDISLDGYEIVLINSNVHHEHATSGYNDRRRSCEEGLEALKKCFPERSIASLRDVDMDMLLALRSEFSETVFRRCKYVLDENTRVLDTVKALSNRRWELMGQLLFASHDGMRDEYEITCPELDFLVEEARRSHVVIGSRMMGGGFGGCTINIVEEGRSGEFYNEEFRSVYFNKYGIMPERYDVKICNGTEVVRNV